MMLLIMGLWTGCSEKEATDTAQETEVESVDTAEESETDQSFGDATSLNMGDAIVLEQETLLEDVHAAWFHDGQLLAQTEDGLWFRDVTAGEWIFVFHNTEEDIQAFGVGTKDEILVSTSSAIWTLDNTRFRRSPLSDLFTEPVLQFMQDDVALWLQTQSGLFQFKNGFLREITFAESSLQGPVITGTVAEGYPSVWIAGEEGVAELRIQGTHVETQRYLNQLGITNLVRAKDQTWMMGEAGDVFLYDGTWREVEDVPSVTSWSAHPSAPQVWIASDTGIQLLAGDTVHETGQQGEILGTDSSGRLLLLQDGNLLRLGEERRVGIRNVPTLTLSEGVLLHLDPMHRSDLDTLEMTIDEEPVELQDNSFELLPGHYEGGTHTIVVTASYNDGNVSSTNTSFRIAGGEVLWDTDISPLNVQYCLDCHAGGTNTELNTKQAWIDKIDRVLFNVVDGTMPLGDTMLSPEEVSLIEAWRDNGFQ